MPGKSGRAPRQKCAVALILIDVINRFEFPDAEPLLKNALLMAPRLVRLKERATLAGIPVIYVNDNFGQWRSNADQLIKSCLQEDAPGQKFVAALRPGAGDYLILKPMHSAFYQSPLDTLLKHLGASTLIVGGLATNSCVVCTVHDANMRGFRLFVPADCCAARSRREHIQAIEHIRTMGNANVARSSALRLGSLLKKRPA